MAGLLGDNLTVPERNYLLGLLADATLGVSDWATSPKRTQQMQGVAKFLEIPAIATTIDRMSYGEPLTSGSGWTTKMKPETEAAALSLLGLVPVGKSAEPAVMAAGRAGERYAEKVVPQIMERGGMPASLLGDLATNTTSKMFIGASSPMFDKDMALKASQMAKKGKSPQEIWQATGSVKGQDGQWRQEISDMSSTMKGSGDFGKTIMGAYERGSQKTGDQLYKTNVDDVLFHNKLAQAYPELMQIETQMMPKDRTARGSLIGTGEGQVLRVREDLPSEDARSTMLHELQHAIQEKEGFSVGGNTRDFAKMRHDAMQRIGDLNSRMSEIVKQMDSPTIGKQEKIALKSQYDDLMRERMSLVPTAQIDPMDAYGHLMGEAEARLTQRRMNLTPEERKKYFPFEYTGQEGYGLDVRPEDMIHMTTSGEILQRGLLGR